MILAAGRGERMRPLTDACPKPLLAAGGKPLICWHLERLARAGIREVVINHAHLGTMLLDRLGDGQAFNLKILWSAETQGALETAGGIRNALPLLGKEKFLVVNGDIYCEWDLGRAPAIARDMASHRDLAHLVMVANPPQHPDGDFVLQDGRILNAGAPRLTFSGIGIYDTALFAMIPHGQSAKLAPLLVAAMVANQVGGEYYAGRWTDVGTPPRLATLDQELRAQSPDV